MVADRILDHPGPVLATSTRADLYESTAGARALRGPVYMFNPQDVGGVPSTLKWDLLGPCKDLVMARRMASWLKVPEIGGDLQWFQQKGDVALMALLWAAAVTGRTILDVYEWVQLHGHATCLEILASHPGSTRQMFAVAKRMFEENRTSGSIRDTIDLTLSWAILPGLAAAVTPAPGRGFSAADFTTSVRDAVPDRQRRRRFAGDAAVPGAGLLGALRGRPGGQQGPAQAAGPAAADGARRGDPDLPG